MVKGGDLGVRVRVQMCVSLPVCVRFVQVACVYNVRVYASVYMCVYA